MSAGVEDFRAALDTFEAVAAHVDPACWDDASPCPGWSARALAGHLVDAQRQIVHLLAHNEGLTPSTEPAQLAGADPVAALSLQRRRTERALHEVEPTAVITTPGGDAAIDSVLGQLALEPLVHAWDLATATSVVFTADSALAARLLDLLLPAAAAITATGMYGTSQPYDGHDPFARLLALLGRAPTPARPPADDAGATTSPSNHWPPTEETIAGAGS